MKQFLIILALTLSAFGQSDVVGSSGNISGSGNIFVFVPTTITVTPPNTGIPIGGTVQYLAVLNDQFGNMANACINSGWSSTNTGVATISSSGLATGVSNGTTTIKCTSNGLTGSTPLTVEGAPNFTNPVTPCTQPCPLPNAPPGQLYSFTFAAGGGTPPYIFSLTIGTLPTGLSLLASGLVSGTPTGSGTSIFTVQVCDNVSSCNSNKFSINVTACGAPTYPCSYSPSFASCIAGTINCNPNYAPTGLLQPQVTATQWVGKANVTGNTTVTWVSSPAASGQTGFPTSCPNTQMTINNTAATISTCSAATITLTGGGVPNGTNLNYAICEGTGCQNGCFFDTTINPAGNIDQVCIVIDSTATNNGQGIGNFTCSGGANNNTISALGNYMGAASAGGNGRLYHIQLTGNPLALQVINTGIPAIVLPCPGGFLEAPADDQAWYYLTNNSGNPAQATSFHKLTWDTAATTPTDNQIIDFSLCPGIYPLTINGNVLVQGSEVVMSSDDGYITQSFGEVGGQGFNHIIAEWEISTGKCSAVDLYSGNYWTDCVTGSAGDSCSTELPTGTMATGGTSCWGVPAYTGFADTTDGKHFTTHNGSNFGFSTNQNLALHCKNSAKCDGTDTPLSSPPGFSCLANGTIQCLAAMTSVSGNSLTISSTRTAAQLGCAALPCTVQYAVINGIHGLQESGDGLESWVSFGANGGWGIPGFSKTTATACSQGQTGANSGTQATFVTYVKGTGFTGASQFANANPAGTCVGSSCTGTQGTQWGSHPSLGQTNNVSMTATNPNIRANSFLQAWTNFSGSNASLWTDVHGTFLHDVAGTGTTPNDNGPWLLATDAPTTGQGTGACGNPTYCPNYLNQAIFAMFPSVAYPPGQNPVIFTHTFNCGNATNARCTDGTPAIFGELDSINNSDPQGRFACWAISMLHNLGVDSAGNKFVGVACVVLQ